MAYGRHLLAFDLIRHGAGLTTAFTAVPVMSAAMGATTAAHAKATATAMPFMFWLGGPAFLVGLAIEAGATTNGQLSRDLTVKKNLLSRERRSPWPLARRAVGPVFWLVATATEGQKGNQRCGKKQAGPEEFGHRIGKELRFV